MRSSEVVWDQPCNWRGGRGFTCSMSDFWHEDVPPGWLDEALNIIEHTPHLTFQVLTKRSGNVNRRLADIGCRRPPKNIWLGGTIGHRQTQPLLKPLLKIDVETRFLSLRATAHSIGLRLDGIDWLIAGGESGRKPRPTRESWVRDIRDLYQEEHVPFFLKQWGNWPSNPTSWEEELDPAAKGGATLDGRLWREFPQISAR